MAAASSRHARRRVGVVTREPFPDSVRGRKAAPGRPALERVRCVAGASRTWVGSTAGAGDATRACASPERPSSVAGTPALPEAS
jgi:hypothetical protein